ncbi:MAG TPA: hypothetical protein VKB34_06245, partial [Povalibacter sp.]|nr:hypothetical protein [Povalibacter sp.]
MARTLGEADLGNAASGATLAFSIPAAKGFSADAALDQEMKRVAAWESIEISGMTTEENLVP